MAFGCALARLHDTTLAEDAAQEAFIEAYRHLEQVRDVVAFPAWLRRIVLSQCERVRRRSHPVLSLSDAVALPTREAGPEEALLHAERRDCVQQAVRALPDAERAATLLYYGGGYSTAEIAMFLETTPGAVRQRLHAARKRLRERIPIEMVTENLKEVQPSRDTAFAEKVAARLRPFHIEDWKAVEEIAHATRPDDPHGVTAWMRTRREFDETARFRRHYTVVDETSGAVLGYGGLEQQGDDPKQLRIYACVTAPDAPPEVRDTLYERLLNEATAAGATRLWARDYADETEALDFLRAQGFADTHRSYDMHLDIATAPEPTLPLPEGVRLLTFAELPAAFSDTWAERITNLLNLLRAETNSPDLFPPVSQEQIRDNILAPERFPDGNLIAMTDRSLIAMRGDDFIGISALVAEKEMPEAIRVQFVGVLPEWRGLGIAEAMLARQVQEAREAGVRTLRAIVPGAATALQAALREAGFVERYGYIRLERSL
jgi:RNA polymerase sigma factor (sigma-70 family)